MSPVWWCVVCVVVMVCVVCVVVVCGEQVCQCGVGSYSR